MPRKKKDRPLVQVRKRKVVVNVEALERFLREFRPEWVGLLTEISELAFSELDPRTLRKWGFTEDHYFATDRATDVLWELFSPDRPHAVFPPEPVPPVTYDPFNGDLVIHQSEPPIGPREPEEGELPGEIAPIAPTLATRPNTQN